MDQNQNTTANSAPNPNQSAPQNEVSSNKGMAILAYLGILILIPFLTEAKNDPFVKFHMKQGLTLIILFVASMIIGVVPLLGWLISFVLCVAGLIFVIIGILNVLGGKQKELPIIGKYSKHFNF